MHRIAKGLTLALLAVAPVRAAEWRSKVEPAVLDRLAATGAGETDVLIVLDRQADLSAARALSTKIEKGRFVVAALRAAADASQRPVLDELDRRGRAYRPFWIINAIATSADLETISTLAARADVAKVEANPAVRLQVLPQDGADFADAPTAVEWNIAKVNADDVWALGVTGQGVVVGGQDSGYDWSHPALKTKYRGWNGTSADHNHNWHDAIHVSAGLCGGNANEPCDDLEPFSHGTHTMGTMVGDDGGANKIGMAPGARWIGCRNMDQGNGTPATYLECYQWFLAPTDMAGNDPEPALAPDVINNSWECLDSEGCTDPNVLRAAVENLRAAGILSVQAAGNSSTSCAGISTPSAIYDASFSVGNTTSADDLNSANVYSSRRGPVTVDGSGRRKPDIAAPGTSIRSAVRGGSYATGTGTSMASPHVVGLVALLISAEPRLRGNVEAIEEIVRESANPAVTVSGGPTTCGGIPSTTVPNNHFGWGRIDALAAVDLALSGFLFRDGFEDQSTDDWSETSPAP